jgi:hypothetical protein
MDGADRGDILLLTYAGHGGLEPERVPGSEPSGYDQTLIFSGFDCLQGTRSIERVVDDEIHEMLQAAGRKGLRVVFVADCCHAGTLTRSMDPRMGAEPSYRGIDRYVVTSELSPDRPQPQPPAQQELPNVLFFAAAQDHELAPEIEIDGRPHGALSAAFARALAGHADTDRNGSITGLELATYVRRYIRAVTDSGQHPNVRWPTSDVRSGLSLSDALFYLPGGSAAATESPALTAPIRLRILNATPGEAERIVDTLKGAELAGAGEEADLTWDAGSADALNRSGQRIASGIKPSGLQAVVERVRAVDAALRMAAERGLDLKLLLPDERVEALPSLHSDRVHAAGTRLTCIVAGMRNPHFALFNIAGDGTVQLLYPLRQRKDAPTIEIARPFSVPQFEVAPPFGADHLVAIASSSPLDALTDALEAINGRRAAGTALEVLTSVARVPDVQVGVQAVYTAER